MYEPINKPQSGQHTLCVKPQEGCFARGWALLPSLKSPGRTEWTGKALWSGLHWVVMCYWAVGGGREAAYFLCEQSDLQAFSRIRNPGGKRSHE